MRVGFKLLHISVQFSENLNTEVFASRREASEEALLTGRTSIEGATGLGKVKMR